jgi:hypothetical protein
MEKSMPVLRQMLAGLNREADRNSGTNTYNDDTPFSLQTILKEAVQPPSSE